MKEVEDYSRVHRGRQFPEVTFDRTDSPENEKCRHVDTTTAGFKDVYRGATFSPPLQNFSRP